MKRRFVFFLLCLSISLSAQNSSMQAKFEASLPDSVKYVLPSFKPGRVVYKNGEYSNGVLNISTIDMSLRFIQDDGQEMSVANIDEVDRVTIGGILFLRQQNGFYGIVEQAGDVCLCVEKRMIFDDTKSGAYGRRSSTTNLKEMHSLHSEQGVDFDLSGEVRYTIREKALLYRDGRMYAPGKRQFLRLFPDKKDVIEEWTKENKHDADDYNSILPLFQLLK